MLPFTGALNAFLAIFSLLPRPIFTFVAACLGLFLVAVIIRFLSSKL